MLHSRDARLRWKKKLTPKSDNPDVHRHSLAHITVHLQQASSSTEKEDNENHCAFLTSHEHTD